MPRCMVTAATLLTVCLLCGGFNIDSQNSAVHREDADSYFGYRVQTFGESHPPRIIVSAPLAIQPISNGTGAVYNCDARGRKCQRILIPGSPTAHVDGIGLSVATSPRPSSPELLVCSPALSYTCGQNTFINGICYQFDQTLSAPRNLTPAFQECPVVQLDVAFLIDGSGSIEEEDFKIMQDFILKVMNQLKGKDTQFAIAQFSDKVETEFSFRDWHQSTDHDLLVRNIKQMNSLTYTPSGIKYVAEKIFTAEAGARSQAKRMMIVITDGESNDHDVTFPEAIQAAEAKSILRYAIGVGDVFDNDEAKKELGTIASSPSQDFVFKVGSYAALREIQESLKDKIFAIEGGASSSNTTSFQHEMAQSGFSSMFTQDSLLLGAVGSWDWAGAVLEILNRNETFVRPSVEMPNAYLGYSMVGVRRGGETLAVVGAPRYRHIGGVLVLGRGHNGNGWETRQVIRGQQIGSYFGAELCSVDIDGDGETDLLLVGAPLYYEAGVGGVVWVCNITQQGNVSCSSSLRGEPGDGLGRFGSSIAGLRDLNGDGLADVAVGAPLEDEHRGSVYIYQGATGGLESQYSQRIPGSKAAQGLEYFGASITGNVDLNGDGLTDLVVGARGGIVILRSSPVLSVEVTLRVSPGEIPLPDSECGLDRRGTSTSLAAHLCFQLTRGTQDTLGPLNVTLDVTAQLDPGRQQSRLHFQGTGRSVTQQVPLTLGTKCVTLNISVQDCIEDFLTPVDFLLGYCTQEGPGSGQQGARPAFRNKCVRSLSWTIPFNNPCKRAGSCVTDLKINATLTSSGILFVKSGDTVSVRIGLWNEAELARLPVLDIRHPGAVSFRKITVLKSNRKVLVTCTDGGGGELSHTRCNVGHPVIREKTEVSLLVTFNIPYSENLDESLVMNLSVSSENERPETLQDNSVRLIIAVRHEVNLAIRSVPNTVTLSFTLGRRAARQVTHKYQVHNIGRQTLPVSVTLFFNHRSDVFLWAVRNVTVEEEQSANLVHCRFLSKVGGHGPLANATVTWGDQNCDWEVCQVIQCTVDQLTRNSILTFVLGGELVIDGQIQNGTGTETYTLQSSARLDFSRSKYSQKDSGLNREALLRAKTVTIIEMEVDSLPYIVGGAVGGAVLLLITALIFYKVGFFKRSYKDIMNEGQDTACTEPLNEPPSAPPDA